MPVSPDRRPRLLAYATLLGVFELTLAMLARKRAEQPCLDAADLVRFGLTTYKLTNLIAHERVTSVVREPFVDDAGGEEERPASGAFRGAVGELVTCPYCLGPWAALTLTAAHSFAPGATRFVTGVFSVVAIADFFHRGNELLTAKTDEHRALAAE